jgi:RNA polymerase sigma-70 factor (ECF subfamily)
VNKINDLKKGLFEKIQHDDEHAFSTLFREYYERLYLFAGRFVKDPQIAENVVQDVFVKLWINKNEIAITHNIKAYLYTAVKNHALNYIKQDKRLIPLEESLESTEAGNASPEEDFINDEHLKAIHKAVEDLPEQCRKIYQMKKYDDLSYKEISEVLGISINTVKTQMRRALKSLLIKLAYLRLIIFFFTQY